MVISEIEVFTRKGKGVDPRTQQFLVYEAVTFCDGKRMRKPVRICLGVVARIAGTSEWFWKAGGESDDWAYKNARDAIKVMVMEGIYGAVGAPKFVSVDSVTAMAEG